MTCLSGLHFFQHSALMTVVVSEMGDSEPGDACSKYSWCVYLLFCLFAVEQPFL